MSYFTDSVSDLCQGIVDKVDTYEKRIKYLEEENKKLKEEHYKDSEMQRMEAKMMILLKLRHQMMLVLRLVSK